MHSDECLIERSWMIHVEVLVKETSFTEGGRGIMLKSQKLYPTQALMMVKMIDHRSLERHKIS